MKHGVVQVDDTVISACERLLVLAKLTKQFRTLYRTTAGLAAISPVTLAHEDNLLREVSQLYQASPGDEFKILNTPPPTEKVKALLTKVIGQDHDYRLPSEVHAYLLLGLMFIDDVRRYDFYSFNSWAWETDESTGLRNLKRCPTVWAHGCLIHAAIEENETSLNWVFYTRQQTITAWKKHLEFLGPQLATIEAYRDNFLYRVHRDTFISLLKKHVIKSLVFSTDNPQRLWRDPNDPESEVQLWSEPRIWKLIANRVIGALTKKYEAEEHVTYEDIDEVAHTTVSQLQANTLTREIIGEYSLKVEYYD